MTNESSSAESLLISRPPRDPLDAVPHNIGEALFELAVSVIWSDGPLERNEVARTRALATALDVVPPRGGVLGAIADGAIPFAELAFEQLDNLYSCRAFAIALWLSPSPVSPRREAFLAAIQTRMGVSQSLVQRLQTIVRTIESTAGENEAAAARHILQAAAFLDVSASA